MWCRYLTSAKGAKAGNLVFTSLPRRLRLGWLVDWLIPSKVSSVLLCQVGRGHSLQWIQRQAKDRWVQRAHERLYRWIRERAFRLLDLSSIFFGEEERGRGRSAFWSKVPMDRSCGSIMMFEDLWSFVLNRMFFLTKSATAMPQVAGRVQAETTRRAILHSHKAHLAAVKGGNPSNEKMSKKKWQNFIGQEDLRTLASFFCGKFAKSIEFPEVKSSPANRRVKRSKSNQEGRGPGFGLPRWRLVPDRPGTGELSWRSGHRRSDLTQKSLSHGSVDVLRKSFHGWFNRN